MKKLYRKGTVHPSSPLVSDHLSFLPATILTLTVALTPEDREVLAYLISCSSTNFSSNRRTTTTTAAAVASGSGTNDADHPACFSCYCFRCYMSYWVRWDSSPNRQLIHEIIDAYEDELLVQTKKEKSKKERRKSRRSSGLGELKRSDQLSSSSKDFTDESENPMEESSSRRSGVAGEAGEYEEEIGKGSVRRLVSFLGEKLWGLWT